MNNENVNTIEELKIIEKKLPTSPDELYKLLDNFKLKYKCYFHKPLNTVEESKIVQKELLSSNKDFVHIKNLYLRDHKKKNFLIVAEQDQKIDLKVLKDVLCSGRLSFGSPERLMENLGVFPGAVTPFSMINGLKNNVMLYLDKNINSYSKIYAHPLVNHATLEISVVDLIYFLNKMKITFNWINFES